MIAISGLRTTIAEAFVRRLPDGESIFHLTRDRLLPTGYGNRYLIAQGLLLGRTARDHSAAASTETWEANFLHIVQKIDHAMDTDSAARVVVIGSESAFAGSYDMAYAGAKAALHLYVETKKLKPHQQLVAISPGIIADSGMTLRRQDTSTLEERRAAHPKQRFLSADEVARLAHFLLYVDDGYLSGTVIRMNGGENAQR